MPRSYDSDEQERSGSLLTFAEIVDCPGCDESFVGTFTDDSMNVEDIVEPPTGKHVCPSCSHEFETAYSGWSNYGDA